MFRMAFFKYFAQDLHHVKTHICMTRIAPFHWKNLPKGCVISVFLILTISGIVACHKESDSHPVGPVIPSDTADFTCPVEMVDVNTINDTYYDLAGFDKVLQWGPYNVHDPSVVFTGDCFACFSTDAMYGMSIQRAGVQIRMSGDLIGWKFMGWAFPGIPSMANNFIQTNGGQPVENVWAPYIFKSTSEYRLYYSQASNVSKLSVIGLATSTKIKGPWIEKGLVVTSSASVVMPNAIDPTVITDKNGRYWMIYGSSWDGIYLLELDPVTGLAKVPGSKGKRIAHRGFTNGIMNGNIEAPEIIYNPDFDMYYLFISYDWLETKYNVRVGRASSVEGPYYDFNNRDLNTFEDNIPMILAPYAFNGHQGWQGTGHCSVFKKEGQYFMAHQGRPVENKYFMDLHIRKIFWTEDGWPVVSPERYAGIQQTPVTEEEITGYWEYLPLHYRIVPGFGEEQTSPDLQKSDTLELHSDGTFNHNPSNIWSYHSNKQIIELNWASDSTDRLIIERGWDWERKQPAVLFTGLNSKGTAIWGKKIP